MKIKLRLKNIWNTPTSKVLSVTGIVASAALYYVAPSLNPATIGGAVALAVLGLLAGKEPAK